jgi:hypothetical protein
MMENLIKDLIQRLENVKIEERSRILQYQKQGVDDAALFLAGKIVTLDYCINELQRMVNYARQSELVH